MDGWWAWLCFYFLFIFAFFRFNDEFKCFEFVLTIRVLVNFKCPSNIQSARLSVCLSLRQSIFWLYILLRPSHNFCWEFVVRYIWRLSVCLKSIFCYLVILRFIYYLAELIFRFQWFLYSLLIIRSSCYF